LADAEELTVVEPFDHGALEFGHDGANTELEGGADGNGLGAAEADAGTLRSVGAQGPLAGAYLATSGQDEGDLARMDKDAGVDLALIGADGGAPAAAVATQGAAGGLEVALHLVVPDDGPA